MEDLNRHLSQIVTFVCLVCIPLVICTTISCPIHFPYSYYNGRYCCLFNEEKPAYEHRGNYTDGLCDGSEMTPDSECCLENQFIRCPGITCESLTYETYPCTEEFPFAYYNGQYCCKSALEKTSYSGRGYSSGCSGGNLTRDSLCCLDDQFNKCAHPPCADMSWWSFTWMAEGYSESSDPNITRTLRVPPTGSGGYGLTLGRGYDMAMVFPGDIYGDLTAVGVSVADATVLRGASGKDANESRQFFDDNDLSKFTITRRQEWELFKILRDAKINAAKMILSDNSSSFGYVDFDSLQSPIKALVLDMFFRNEYYSNVASLQPVVVQNDPSALVPIMNDRSKWVRSSDERFLRRKAYIEKAAST